MLDISNSWGVADVPSKGKKLEDEGTKCNPSSLLYIIRRNKHTISLYNLHKQVCEHLISKGFSDQTPCLSLCDDKPTFSLSKNTTEIKIKKTYHKMFMKLY